MGVDGRRLRRARDAVKYVERYRGLFITAATARGRVVLVVTRPDGMPRYMMRIDAPAIEPPEGKVAPEVAAALAEIRSRIDEGRLEE